MDGLMHKMVDKDDTLSLKCLIIFLCFTASLLKMNNIF